LFGDLRQRPDGERSQIADPRGRPQANGVDTQTAIRADVQLGLDQRVAFGFELRNLDARRVEQQFLGVAESSARKRRFHLRPALEAGRADGVHHRRDGRRGRRGGEDPKRNGKEG